MLNAILHLIIYILFMILSNIYYTISRIISNHRDTLKIVVLSLPHEMPKLEEFFDGVPVVDLSYLDDKKASRDRTKLDLPNQASNDETTLLVIHNVEGNSYAQ